MEELLKRYPALSVCAKQIEKTVDILVDTYYKGGKILLCGNGGSAADCEHIAGELLKSFVSQRKMPQNDLDMINAAFPDDAPVFYDSLQRGVPVIPLPSLVGVSSAYNNDVRADMVYAQLVYAYKAPFDALLGISTSGNSKNVVNAAKVAKALGLRTIALTGEKKCLLDDICDVVIKAPASETYKIQEYHLPIYHYICLEIEKILFG